MANNRRLVVINPNRKYQARIEAMEKIIEDIDSGRVEIKGRSPIAVKRGLRKRIRDMQEGKKQPIQRSLPKARK